MKKYKTLGAAIGKVPKDVPSMKEFLNSMKSFLEEGAFEKHFGRFNPPGERAAPRSLVYEWDSKDRKYIRISSGSPPYSFICCMVKWGDSWVSVDSFPGVISKGESFRGTLESMADMMEGRFMACRNKGSRFEELCSKGVRKNG